MTQTQMEEVTAAAERFVSCRILHNDNLYLYNTSLNKLTLCFKLQAQALFKTMMNGKSIAKHTTQTKHQKHLNHAHSEKALKKHKSI